MGTGTIEEYLKYASEMATISPAAVELINLVDDPNVSREKVADLVSKDEVLYANVFKLVNSAVYSLVRKPRDINQAIEILGMNELRNIVFIVAAKKAFVDLDLWYRSVFVAVTAEKISQQFNQDNQFSGNTYIAGLMHSIGTQIFKTFLKSEYDEISPEDDFRTRLNKEENIFGVNSLALSYEVAKDYQLPDSIVEIIKNQTNTWQDEDFHLQNAVLEIAISLSELGKEDLDQEDIDEALDTEMLKKFKLEDLNLDPERLDMLHEEANKFVNQ